MNIKIFCFITGVVYCSIANSQKIYIIPNFVFQNIGLTSQNNKNADFNISRARLNPSIGISAVIEKNNFQHVFSIDYAALGKSFKIYNNFMPLDTVKLGYHYLISSSSINYLLLSYSIRKENKKKHNLFNSKLQTKFNYALGIAYGFNRSKHYYENPTVKGEVEFLVDNYTYIGFESTNKRKGNGAFITASVGFDLFNKKNKRLLCFSLYYNQGLKEMERSTINYKYGFVADPARQLEVQNKILKLRGTNFGLKVGIPIKIKN